MIRVSIDLEESQVAGRRKFIGQLKKELAKYCEIVKSNCNVNLLTDPTEFNIEGAKNIYRLDGLWLDPIFNKDPQERNKVIINTIEKCDYVIYQVNFAREVQQRMYPSCKVSRWKVIYNGADPNRFAEKYIHNKPYFIAYSKWIGDDGIRGHKRLDATVKSFILANLDNVDLFVCGDVEDKINNKNVHYIGWKEGKELDKLISGAVASVHISYVDWCPNAIIESLVAGVPVIYTPNSGVKEFAGDSGYIVEDHPFPFKICDIYHPPQIDLHTVARAYQRSLMEKKKVYRPDLFIETIAKQYFEVIKEVYQG